MPRIVTGTAGGAAAGALAPASWQVYPNPATGTATLLVPAALLREPAMAELYNALGQRVRWQPVPAATAAAAVQVRFSLVGLPPGLFYLHLRTAQGATVRQLVVE